MFSSSSAPEIKYTEAAAAMDLTHVMLRTELCNKFVLLARSEQFSTPNTSPDNRTSGMPFRDLPPSLSSTTLHLFVSYPTAGFYSPACQREQAGRQESR